MPTLFEIIKNKLARKSPVPEKSEEERVWNPLGIKVGAFASLDVLDYRGKQFKIVGVRAYDATTNPPTGSGVSKKHFKCCEYVLRCDEQVAFLRTWPDPVDPKKFNVFLLELKYDTPWDEDGEPIVLACRDPGPELNFKEDNEELGIHDEYWRVDKNPDSFKATVQVLEDLDGSGRVDSGEVVTERLEYWDFWRDWEFEWVKSLQYLYLEMNTEHGHVQGKRGEQIEPERVFIS